MKISGLDSQCIAKSLKEMQKNGTGKPLTRPRESPVIHDDVDNKKGALRA